LNEGNTVKQKFANFMGADADKGFGGSIAQAFSEPGRMFGTNRGFLGTGLFSGGPSAAQQEATAELGKENQSKATVEVIDKLIDKNKNKSVSEIQAKNNKEKVAETGFRSGIDVNDPAAEQLQVLKDILEELKSSSGKSTGGGGGGLLSTAANVGLGAAALGLGKKALGGVGRAGAFLGTAALGLGKKALGGVGNIFRGRAGILRAGAGALTAGGLANSVSDVVPDGVNNNTRVPATATPVPPGDTTTSNKIPKNSSAGAGSKWDRFVKFLSRKAPRLLVKIGPRLAAMAGLLLVPGPGWVAAIISMGFNIMLAWELYGYWKEFSNSPDSEIDETEQVQQESITSPNITPEAENSQQSLQEAADRAGENGPQRQQRQARIDARNTELEGTATPAATTPELVEGTAENVSTTPMSRRQRLEREQGFEGTTSGAPIPILTPEEKSERAMELAEQMNLDPTNLDVEYTGQVPAVINGVAVPSELLTEDEKYQQNSAKAAREMLQSTQSEVAARQATLNNRGIETGEANASSVTQSPSVTSNAIQNMTNLSTSSTQSAPPIINNITNNNTSASPAAPQILTTPSTPRNNSNIIQRFQDRTFAGI
jgi:hypothetical protein